MKTVLFVCMGNICRSPTAEGVFRSYVDDHLPAGSAAALAIDSAGTSAYHEGEPADQRMQTAARARGYELTSRSRPVVDRDFHRFDLIVAMDQDNLDDLEARSRRSGRAGSAEIKLFSEFLDDSWPTEVPDPYYGGAGGFRYVVEMIEAGCEKLAEHLLQKPHSER